MTLGEAQYGKDAKLELELLPCREALWESRASVGVIGGGGGSMERGREADCRD